MRMQQDDQLDGRPTVPSLRPYDHNDDDAAAIAGVRDLGGAPTWPVARPHAPGPRAATRDLLPLALSLSLGANVALLLGLVGVLALAHAGTFAPPRSSTSAATQAGTPTSAALSTPSPTTPLSAGWLQIAHSSVQLGCDGDQQTQTVVLTNTGPHRVQWQAVVAVPTDQAGIEVSPSQGGLKAGASVELQVRNTTSSTPQQGVIRFEPDASDAGTPPSLSYTTQSCG